jgi:hypothetical protein
MALMSQVMSHKPYASAPGVRRKGTPEHDPDPHALHTSWLGQVEIRRPGPAPSADQRLSRTRQLPQAA